MGKTQRQRSLPYTGSFPKMSAEAVLSDDTARHGTPCRSLSRVLGLQVLDSLSTALHKPGDGL